MPHDAVNDTKCDEMDARNPPKPGKDMRLRKQIVRGVSENFFLYVKQGDSVASYCIVQQAGTFDISDGLNVVETSPRSFKRT
ncbi:15873_t:CDS:2 [Acaulospora morrowiae]|uniref:15873_t:CDS:1 n=1 Tax=Acaulospora morrowiae TaxID=94023 RepID=A0A9N9I4J4_9GLOM|nr:15873_t:CDS:2 [Acaulospora morrowiae]